MKQFDYKRYCNLEDIEEVKATARFINSRPNSTSKIIMLIGEKLDDAKRRIARGGFNLWVDIELKLANWKISRYIRIYNKFKNRPYIKDLNVNFENLYRLSLDTTPGWIIEGVFNKLQNKEKVTVQDLRKLCNVN